MFYIIMDWEKNMTLIQGVKTLNSLTQNGQPWYLLELEAFVLLEKNFIKLQNKLTHSKNTFKLVLRHKKVIQEFTWNCQAKDFVMHNSILPLFISNLKTAPLKSSIRHFKVDMPWVDRKIEGKKVSCLHHHNATCICHLRLLCSDYKN